MNSTLSMKETTRSAALSLADDSNTPWQRSRWIRVNIAIAIKTYTSFDTLKKWCHQYAYIGYIIIIIIIIALGSKDPEG